MKTGRKEPPKFRPLVIALYYLGKILGKGPRTSPHLSGGSEAERLDFEWNQKDGFFREAKIDPWILYWKSVLDIGCGYGGKATYYEHKYIPWKIVGVDYRLGRDLLDGRLSLIKARYEDIAFESFDVILCEDVLEHVDNPRLILEKAYSELKPGGIIIIKFPSIKSIVAHHFDRACNLPGIHYLFSFKSLASGFNWLNLSCEKFDEVVNGLTSNLNGLTMEQFGKYVNDVGFKTLRLEALPYWHFPGEVMSKTIIYIGTK